MAQIFDGFLADTHVHSMFSHDCDSPLEDICAAAKEKGIAVVCITDHADVKPITDMEKLIADRKKIPGAIEEAKKKVPGLQVLVGIELACGGYYPNNDIFAEAAQ